MSNTFDKLSVLDSFIEEVNSYLPDIDTNLDRLVQSPGDMDALEETYRRTHTIGGSASMMDFPGLAHVAHGMEDILGDALDGLISLDEPALGLLRRSLGRLHQLLEGIRNGIDEESVIAEDDADYARYRALVDSSLSASQGTGQIPVLDSTTLASYQQPSGQQAFTTPTPSLATPPVSVPVSPSLPSFDEVLASFRAPSVQSGEDVAWPEDPVIPRLEEAPSVSPVSNETTVLSTSSATALNYISEEKRPLISEKPNDFSVAPSALEALIASTRQSSQIQDGLKSFPLEIPDTREKNTSEAALPPASPLVQQDTEALQDYNQVSNTVLPWAEDTFSPVSSSSVQDEYTHRDLVEAGEANQVLELPQEYTNLQRDVQSLDSQLVALKQMVGQLREAMSVIDGQRGEFKGFLNGSKDALERMEDWAGKAMGLNLRNSPDQVRRYLPLSVMWVSNSKLKKVFDLLGKITSNVEMTDEQTTATIQQLNSSIADCGALLQQWQERTSQPSSSQTPWSPWEIQEQDRNPVRERVTFERHGNLSALRAAIEAEVREEVRREVADRSPAPVNRAELEQQIREELRREFEEAQRQQQEAQAAETRRELEARLRNEIELQVRQDVLAQLSQAGDDAAAVQKLLEQDNATKGSNAPARNSAPLAPASPSSSVVNARPPVESALAKPAAPANKPPATSTKSSVSASIGDFGDEAVEIFRMEAEEHLQTIGTHVAALEKDPHNRDLIQGIRRATHTLKGAAGMMGFRSIADLSHISEDLLDMIMDGEMTINSAILSIILDTAETLDFLITSGGSDPAAEESKVHALQVRYTELLGERGSSPNIDEDLDDEEHTSPVKNTLADDHDTTSTESIGRPAHGDLTVRVRLQRLDELVNLFGELLVNRSVLEERIQRLVRLVADVSVSSNRLRDVGQKLESRFEAATLPSGRSVQVMPGQGNQNLLSSPAGAKTGRSGNLPEHLAEFDELELDRYTEFHQLARGLSEGISDMVTLSTEMDTIMRECEGVFARENRLSTTFQDRLMKTRLVPLSQLTPRLYRAARAIALKQGKEFEFVREGEGTEVDRTVFEEISGPLLHLVRNAVDHALETPNARTVKGKAPVGMIKLSAAYEGNQIVISVRDDGRGLDREHIRQTAISRGLIRPDQPLSEKDLVSLIFYPSFSTADVLSEESGRGVGLDVVGDAVSRLRGTIVVESMPDQGTTFTMIFPTSLAIQRAMIVRVSGQQFAIPTVHVESIGRFDNFKRTNIAGRPAVIVRNEPYPLQMLASYLSLPNSGVFEDKAQLLLVNAGGNRFALVIDEIKGQSDIVMKNLGPHLRQVHGIAGATVLGNGQVMLVLELNTLLAARPKGLAIQNAPTPRSENPIPMGPGKYPVDIPLSRQGQAVAGPGAGQPAAAVAERGKHILVVDDSPSVRRVVSNMLKQHGWEVQMARDGVEALEMIAQETPAVVLLDIEMPRMDGYELISTTRAQEQYRTLPMIVLTSRAAAKHQQRAMTLGASDYVVKPYQDEELLNTINKHVFGTSPRSRS